MDIEVARQFVREHHRGVLTTFRRDGRPQLSPVSVSIDGQGLVAISSRETAYKVRNLTRDPRASLLVMSDDFWKWVQVDGTAEILTLPAALEPLVEQYRSIAGEHPDWDDYRAAMERERRVLIRIEIERAGPDRSG